MDKYFYIFLAFLAYAIYSFSYYVDDALMTKIKIKNSISNLMVASSLLSGLVLLPLFLFLSEFQLEINQNIIILTTFATLISMLSMFAYYLSLKYLMPNVVSVMFQLIPVFNFVFSIIMGHSYKLSQIIGVILIIFSAIMLSVSQKIEVKRKASLLMVLSSFCFALFYVVFNRLSNETNFYQATVLYQIGLVVFGLVLLVDNQIRKDFVNTVVKNPAFLVANVINKAMNMVANLLVNYAMMFIPIALVSALVGVDPIMTLIFGLIGAKILPKYVDQVVSKKELIKLIIAIILTTFGVILMFIM